MEKKNFAISSELIQKLHNLIQKVSQNSNESHILQMSRKAAQLHPKKKRKFYPIKLIQKITIQISLKKKKSHSNLITSKMLEHSQKTIKSSKSHASNKLLPFKNDLKERKKEYEMKSTKGKKISSKKPKSKETRMLLDHWHENIDFQHRLNFPKQKLITSAS